MDRRELFSAKRARLADVDGTGEADLIYIGGRLTSNTLFRGQSNPTSRESLYYRLDDQRSRNVYGNFPLTTIEQRIYFEIKK
jgi:hypothetical protein